MRDYAASVNPDSIENANRVLNELLQNWRGKVASEQYSLLFFLLHLHYEGRLHTVAPLVKNPLADIELHSTHMSDIHDEMLRSAEDILLPSLRRISSQALSIALIYLDKVEDFNEEEYMLIAEELLNRLSFDQARESSVGMLPDTVSSIMRTIADVHFRKLRIYNPFSGYGSLIDLDDCDYLLSQEINENTWAYQVLRIHANDRIIRENHHIVKSDSITNWPVKESFDLVISAPPLNLNLKPKGYTGFERARDYETFMIEMFIQSPGIKEMVLLVSEPKLYASDSGTKSLREELIKSGYLDTIVSLPAGILTNASVKTSILKLSRNNHQKQTRIVQFEDFIQISRYNGVTTETEAISNVLKGKQGVDLVKTVSIDELENHDNQIHTRLLFEEEVKGVELGEILDVAEPVSKNVNPNEKHYRLGRFKADKLHSTATIPSSKTKGEISTRKSPNPPENLYQGKLLVIPNTPGSSWKPFFIDTKNEAIALDIYHWVFTMKRDDVNLQFLAMELHEDYISEQVRNRSYGSVVGRIIMGSVLGIKVDLPSFEVQNSIINGITVAQKQLNEALDQRNRLAHDLISEKDRGVRELKHALGTPMRNFASNLRLLQSVLDKGAFDQHTKIDLGNGLSRSLSDIVSRLHQEVKRTGTLIKKSSTSLTPKADDVENLHVIETFTEYFNRKKAELLDTKIDFKLNIDQDIIDSGKSTKGREEFEAYSFVGNKGFLFHGLDAIVENVQRHGFSADKEGVIELRISLEAGNSYKLRVSVYNNGERLPDGYSTESFIRSGSTGNDKTGNMGLGGNEINEMVLFHSQGFVGNVKNSTLSLRNIEHSLKYSVVCEFLIPLSKATFSN